MTERSVDHDHDHDHSVAAPNDWRGWGVTGVVVLVGLMVLWPVPAGRMPRSADHQVHLARAQMLWDTLRGGQLRGWTDQWFFGTPIGELYPPLADLLVIGIKGLTVGLASWETAYALAFTAAFVVQGLAMVRAGRALGLGPVPGLVAGILVLVDPGWAREGGWIYTVWFGVWPQVLANALCWLAFAELAFALGPRPGDGAPHRRTWIAPQHPDRHLGLAGIWLGLALLAHPIVLPMAVLGLPALALAFAGPPRTRHLWSGLLRAAVVLMVGLALSAWWLVPMLGHRAWMAAYGWLHEPLGNLANLALKGQWTRLMPATAGHLATIGLVLAVLPLAGWLGRRSGLESVDAKDDGDRPFVVGRRFWRFCGAFALGMWLLSSRDLYWGLRLDLLSDGFTHLQYQRFLIAAKPAFFLLCGAVVGQLAVLASPRLGPVIAPRAVETPRAGVPLPLRIAAAVAALAALALVVRDLGRVARQAEEAAKIDLGQPQVSRFQGDPEFDDHYADFIAWVRGLPEAERGRFAFMDVRNTHWFMDFTAQTGLPLYKAGFTPGDNFAHKPESRHPRLLDALDVRYVVTRGERRSRREPEVASFGPIHVHARAPAGRYPAWLVSSDPARRAGTTTSGEVDVVDARIGEGVLSVQVRDAPPDTLLVTAIGAYPRWQVTVDGATVEPLEAPVFGGGEAIPYTVRASGGRRGGKANGDDGSEPTLLAVPVSGDATVELRYRPRAGRDVLAGLVSLLTLAGLALWLWRPPTRWVHVVEAWLAGRHPALALVPAIALLSVLGMRWSARAAAERDALHAALGGRGPDGVEVAPRGRARPGPLKTDMSIHPAVVIPGSTRAGGVTITFDALPAELDGWFALDDDWAKAPPKGERSFTIAVKGEAEPRLESRIWHRPGRHPIALDLRDLEGRPGVVVVEVTGEGKRPPRFGFDLELE